MKILLPVHHFPPRYSAGAELYTFRLARWLRSRGHEVAVVCVEAIDEGPVGELRAREDSYEGVPVTRLSYNIMEAPQRRHWDHDNPLIGRWFAGRLAESRPDVAHFQAGYLLSAAPFREARRAGVPVALTLHDYWFLCPRITLQRGDGSLCESVPADPAGCAWCRRIEQRRYQLADRYTAGAAGALARATALGAEAAIVAERRDVLAEALGYVDHAVAPSRFLAQRYAAAIPAEKMSVIRYGLDLARFAGLPPRGEGGPLRIGFTGQIAPHKGVHLLVDAFRQLRPGGRPAELHIYGGLDARPDYVADLRRLAGGDPRVTLHGRFENSRAPEILAGLDVAVVPSTWYENSPLAIMEAHAAGTPVVTARLGGMAELVRDGVDGLHFRAADAADLSRALQRLTDEPALLPRLRSGISTPPSIDDECGDLLDIYARLSQQTFVSTGAIA